MCDPLTLGSLAIGAAGTAANTIGKARAEAEQKRRFEGWQKYQEKQREEERVRQEAMHKTAQEAQQKGLEEVSAASQVGAQAAEAKRLEGTYTGAAGAEDNQAITPTSLADTGIATGETTGGNIAASDLARRIADAGASAKERIRAMANVNAYGGSYGGLGTTMPIAQGRAGSAIDVANNLRRGSLQAYGVERNVEPVQVSYSNPLADIASQFLGVGMSGVGNAAAGGAGAGGIGKIFSGALKPVTDPWAGLRTTGGVGF
jgi:hypothetical protein